MLILLVFVAVALADCSDDCPTCNVIDSVSANKLCAGEICINGEPVPPGDGNPCTVQDIVDGVVQTVHVKDCCSNNNQCTQFAPSTCHASTCEKEQGADYGWCKHVPIVDCCTEDCDCPKKPCWTYECQTVPCTSGLFFTEEAGSPHHTPWKRTEAGECRRCVGTAIPDCCIKSSECGNTGLGICGDATVGICDANHECQCIPVTQVECTHATEDQDCAYLEDKLEACDNPCAAIRCVSGYCVIDATVTDADKDGVKCDEDCDDSDADVTDFIWCAVNTTVTNHDNDGFVKCGTSATKVCAAVCGEGLIEVDESSVTCSESDPTNCHVTLDCDCCDYDAGVRPDHELCCEARVPGAPLVTCGGDPRSVCVTKPESSETTDAEECEAWGQTHDFECCNCDSKYNCTNLWTASTECSTLDSCPFDDPCPSTKRNEPARRQQKRQAAICNECNLVDYPELTQANLTCALSCDGDAHPICPLSAKSAPSCCLALRDRGDSDQTHWEFVDPAVQACCEAILDMGDNFPQDGDATKLPETKGVCNYTTTPLITKQCICPDPGSDTDAVYIAFDPEVGYPRDTHQDYCDCTAGPNFDYLAVCGEDKDGDCVAACEPVRVCVVSDPTSVDSVCTDSGYTAPPDSATCDCDDNNSTVAVSHGCFSDEDGDGFVDCTSCQEYCGECPPDTHPLPVVEALKVAPRKPTKVRSPFGGADRKRVVVDDEDDDCNPIETQYMSCPAQGQSVDSPQCDCCDSDPYVFPGSRFCSTKPRICKDSRGGDSYDYNCDDDDDQLVVCEDTVEMDVDDIRHDTDYPGGRYIRGCQASNSSSTNSPNVFIDTETSGECEFTGNNCTTNHGFCLERKRAFGSRIATPHYNAKRGDGDGAIEVPAPIECNGALVDDPEDENGVAYGSCFEYLEDCHARPVENPVRCHCDCDICVLVGQ